METVTRKRLLVAATFLFVLLIGVFTPPTPAAAREVMTDRCSAEVAIVPYYDATPDTYKTIILKRNASGYTDWTQPFRVQLGGGGFIRWWCHSTSGNLFDPGTWRIGGLTAGTVCSMNADGTTQGCRPDASFNIGSSAQNGWTPERSRCDDRSRLLRARLGPNRLLQIECLGR